MIPIHLHNQQKSHQIQESKLLSQAELAASRLSDELPVDLEEISITLLDSSESSRIHDQFFNDNSPTDVMTFMNGDILICPEIAESQRLEAEGLSLHDEILTYIIHGMLHLCGQDDIDDEDFDVMAKRQCKIRDEIINLDHH